MNFFILLLTASLALTSFALSATKPAAQDISHLISQQEFARYQNVADFIEQSPKVTITVTPSKADKDEYGQHVARSLTGSDCDRDGKMDNNATCNAVFYKLWLKYSR
ncbi:MULTISPECIES: hypothetical protein [Colwellia]|uniref:Uncharacterized protein n=1 Tax=Colwellia marinimaniae TaxID=1513592 RepID=A0ABQ0MRH5_9GAMM|nr:MULTISPECIES: hypothetical protein [Colwellia]GAW94970.1 hypothetical protein MTCD1_00569 [Colwellia marinimaniae]